MPDKPVQTFLELLSHARKQPPKRVAIVGAENDIALEAIAQAMTHKIAIPVLIGESDKVRDRISKLNLEEQLAEYVGP